MTTPPIEELFNKEIRALTPQMSGDLLAEIKRLAQEHYVQLGIGTKIEFEKMWRDAFFVHEDPTT